MYKKIIDTYYLWLKLFIETIFIHAIPPPPIYSIKYLTRNLNKNSWYYIYFYLWWSLIRHIFPRVRYDSAKCNLSVNRCIVMADLNAHHIFFGAGTFPSRFSLSAFTSAYLFSIFITLYNFTVKVLNNKYYY